MFHNPCVGSERTGTRQILRSRFCCARDAGSPSDDAGRDGPGRPSAAATGTSSTVRDTTQATATSKSTGQVIARKHLIHSTCDLLQINLSFGRNRWRLQALVLSLILMAFTVYFGEFFELSRVSTRNLQYLIPKFVFQTLKEKCCRDGTRPAYKILDESKIWKLV